MAAECVSIMQGCRHRTTRKRKPDEIDENFDIYKLESESLGPFWFHKSTTISTQGKLLHVGLQQREKIELQELLRQNFITPEFLKERLVLLNDESSNLPRLRMYNWAVTNFAKGRSITTQITEKGVTRSIDPSISYDSALKRLHRTLFDPYRRGTLLFFRIGENIHHTTVGQILFIKWCGENGVDKYVTDHEQEIREHLNSTVKERANKGAKRVRELTSSKYNFARVVG